MASLGPEIFSRGFRFNPTPLQAATYYLPRLVTGAPLHEAVRPVINLADVYSCEPADLARQFCPLPRTGQRFFRQYVLCNIYVSPRADQGSTARQESAAFFAPPAPALVVIAQAAAPKRPAPQSAEPPCSKRMRAAVAPTPPVVQPASFAPPLPYPYVPHIAASAQPPPPPVSTRLAAPPQSRSPASASLQPCSLPKQQDPPPTLPVVRACHMPVEAPARHYQPPQPSVQRKPSTRDPLEAAELRDKAEEQRVAALVDQDDGWADLEKCIDDAVPTADGSTTIEDEMEQHLPSLFEEEELPDAIAAPDPASKGSKSSLQYDLDLFQQILEDTLRRSIPDAIAAADPASKGSKSSLQDDLSLFQQIMEDTTSSPMAFDELTWT